MLNGDQFHEQLPLFVSAREIKEQYGSLDYPLMAHGTKKLFWGEKLAESHVKESHQTQSTYESVKAEGVKTPAQIYIDPYGEKNLGQGHHRVISQYEQDPDKLLPVTFTHSKLKAVQEDNTERMAYRRAEFEAMQQRLRENRSAMD